MNEINQEAVVVIQVVLALTMRALVFGPMLLLWWLPGSRDTAARARRAPAGREVA